MRILIVYCLLSTLFKVMNSPKESFCNPTPPSLLTLLPDEFTREDVRNLRIAQGMKPDPKQMLSKWKLRGQIVSLDERGSYKKVDSRQ